MLLVNALTVLAFVGWVYIAMRVEDSDKWIDHFKIYHKRLQLFLNLENKNFFKGRGAKVLVGSNKQYLRVMLNYRPQKKKNK